MPSEERRAIGARLAEALDRAGLGGNELARRLGKVSSAVSGWKTGRTQPPLEVLAEICRLTGAKADWLIGVGDAAPAPRPNPKKLAAAVQAQELALQKLRAAVPTLEGETEKLREKKRP